MQQGDAVLYVRQLSTTELTEIALLSKTGQTADAMRETFVGCIRSWDGVTCDDGTPLDCTTEIKTAVYEANPQFVEKVLPKINAAVDTAMEEEKKI